MFQNLQLWYYETQIQHVYGYALDGHQHVIKKGGFLLYIFWYILWKDKMMPKWKPEDDKLHV
jgi:hypothetical protein